MLIHDQECATELRRKRKRGLAAEPGAAPVMINERVCEGCGDCGHKSNCLSVQPVDTEFGRKTVIHQSSCNKDFSCLLGDCPSFVTIRPPERRHAAAGRRRDAVSAADAVPDPAPRLDLATSPAHDAHHRLGGTGVVTVSQILGRGRHASPDSRSGRWTRRAWPRRPARSSPT